MISYQRVQFGMAAAAAVFGFFAPFAGEGKLLDLFVYGEVPSFLVVAFLAHCIAWFYVFYRRLGCKNDSRVQQSAAIALLFLYASIGLPCVFFTAYTLFDMVSVYYEAETTVQYGAMLCVANAVYVMFFVDVFFDALKSVSTYSIFDN